VAAWRPDMFRNFYLVKSDKVANNSAAPEARVKISADLESLKLLKCFDVCLTKFENDQILLKIIHSFLVTTALLSG